MPTTRAAREQDDVPRTELTVTAQTTAATSAWDDAVRRATAVANSERPGGMDEDCWDDVAIRDIIATVLYALHLRTGTEVGTVPWSSVLWWLHDDERVISLVEDTVPRAAQALTETTAGTEEAALDRWRWLDRTWDPDAPVRRRNRPSSAWGTLRQIEYDRFVSPVAVAEPRRDGMSRGVAGGFPDPGVVRNSSGVSRPSLSHEGGGPGPGREQRAPRLGVSEIAGKRYSFEIWELAA